MYGIFECSVFNHRTEIHVNQCERHTHTHTHTHTQTKTYKTTTVHIIMPRGFGHQGTINNSADVLVLDKSRLALNHPRQ